MTSRGDRSVPMITKKIVGAMLYANCGEGILVHLQSGEARIQLKETQTDTRSYFNAYLDGQPLVSYTAVGCPTCERYFSSFVHPCKPLKTVRAHLDEVLNQSYEGMQSAIRRIEPLMRLFPSGDYVVGDFDLLPISITNDQPGIRYFWDVNGYGGDSGSIEIAFGPDRYYVGNRLVYQREKTSHAKWSMDEDEKLPFNDHCFSYGPLFVYPSESKACANLERIDAYMAQNPASPTFPRAVGIYVADAGVMLLDGHHKAAAAAALGLPVKCLVIIPIDPFEDEEETNWLFQGSRRFEAVEDDWFPMLYARHQTDGTNLYGNFVPLIRLPHQTIHQWQEPPLHVLVNTHPNAFPEKYTSHLNDYQKILDRLFEVPEEAPYVTG